LIHFLIMNNLMNIFVLIKYFEDIIMNFNHLLMGLNFILELIS